MFSLFSPPIAKSCQNNQTKTFSFLSQLALSSQNKFFLRSPPKFRKKAGADQAPDTPDADLAAELDGEADASEGQSPTVQYERCLSAGLDCAISDLVSLDSQAEVDQGIFFPRGRGHFKSRHGCSSSLRAPLLSFQIPSLPLFAFLHFCSLKMDSGDARYLGSVGHTHVDQLSLSEKSSEG